MSEPKADRCDVDEAQEAFSSLVIAGCDAPGILEFVEASLNHVAQPVKSVIHIHAHLAGLAHWNLSKDAALIHDFPNTFSIITPICQQHLGLRQVIGHNQIETEIIRRLARREFRALSSRSECR